ncbi:MAG: hypothetical protein HY719_09815 [Planctomycetes bacterium]|nr:hypothetical protein [Planctomycetota bacterium]
MRLRQAHRILIAAMIVFASGFALLKARAFVAGGVTADLAFAIASTVVAAGLGWYLSRFSRKYPPPGGKPGDLL